MGRKETGLFGRIFNCLTGTGTTVTRKKDFWGRTRTVVHNYDTGTTREYTHKPGFFGSRTDKDVSRHGRHVGSGYTRRNFWGSYSEYSGTCFRCDGSGIFAPTGQPCRRCGGSGIYRKSRHY